MQPVRVWAADEPAQKQLPFKALKSALRWAVVLVVAVLTLSVQLPWAPASRPPLAVAGAAAAAGGTGGDLPTHGLPQAPHGLSAAQQFNVTESLKLWGSPGGHAHGFRTPRSRCTLLPNGTVHQPSSNSSRGGFLFDTSSYPSREAACSHCPGPKQNNHGMVCCGVCAFGNNLCSKAYPGQNKSQAVAERLSRSGFRLQDLTPCELFARIRGRTLWFMGDSHTFYTFLAAECFLAEFSLTLQRTPAVEAGQNLKLRMVAHASAPLCLPLAHNTRVCGIRVDYASDMQNKVLPGLMRLLPSFSNDVVVYNTGVHYTEHEDGQVRKTYLRDLSAFAAWRQQHAARLPRFVWLDTGPQHFTTPLGLFPGGKMPFKCRPLQAWYDGVPEMLAGSWRNQAVAPLIPRLADAHLRMYNASVPFWDSHLPGECSHWCHPGVYQFWLYQLNDVLRDSGLGAAVHVPGRAARASVSAADAHR